MITRKHKDSLFRFIFGRSDHKEWLLSLYNALNHSNYTNPEDIEMTTIDNVIYLGMHNDVSFIIEDNLMMMEHQTTPSKNMTIRFLLYYAKVLEGYLQKRNIDLYKISSIPLPNPRFIVFYNGSRETGEYEEERFSTHYKGSPNIELVAEHYNINKGMNDSLKDACQALEEYCWINDMIVSYRDTMSLDEAVEQTYNNLPKEFIIYPLLIKHKAEVKGMILETFDQDRFGKTMYESGFEEGEARGIKKGIVKGEDKERRKIAIIMRNANEPIDKIIEYTGLT
ncbi:MAG: hypothetical protein IKE51_02580, partial [Solobacterium sp.]|nr:hypothetical protein [Solobacterium sp.]